MKYRGKLGDIEGKLAKFGKIRLNKYKMEAIWGKLGKLWGKREKLGGN